MGDDALLPTDRMHEGEYPPADVSRQSRPGLHQGAQSRVILRAGTPSRAPSGRWRFS